MTPVAFFMLMVMTMIALVGISQIPLVADVVTSTGYSPTEIWSGIAGVLVIFYVVVGIFTVK